MRNHLLALALVLGGCRACGPAPSIGDLSPMPVLEHQLTFANDTDSPTTVYVSFGSDSKVNAASWGLCGVPADAGALLNCSFPLSAKTSLPMPLRGQYLNATIAFGAPVGCGSTKAELNLNNPSWYDVVDVSLVDGYSNRIRLDVAPPALDGGVSSDAGVSIIPNGATGNESVPYVFPLACDICSGRQNPPCGQPVDAAAYAGASDGGVGCHAGTQYAPVPPCQYQGLVKGGGSVVRVALEK